MANPLHAVITFLKADAGVSALTGARVWGQRIPRDYNADVDTEYAVLVRTAGGPSDARTIPLAIGRFDIRAFGPSDNMAHTLHLAVVDAMKNETGRIVAGNTLVHSATMESGPISIIEPDSDWPYVISSWLVRTSEISTE